MSQVDRHAADVVVAATPINLGALIQVNKPILRAHYEFAEIDEPSLGTQLAQFLF